MLTRVFEENHCSGSAQKNRIVNKASELSWDKDIWYSSAVPSRLKDTNYQSWIIYTSSSSASYISLVFCTCHQHGHAVFRLTRLRA